MSPRGPFARKSLVTLVPAIVIAAGIAAGSIVRMELLSTEFHDGIVGADARYALALKAADALHDALANEKDAMVMIGKAGLDEYATGWMTDIDHLRAATASLQLLADTPEQAAGLEPLWTAIDAYVAAGQTMYKLKVERQSDSAIALSNTAAEAARNRLADLIARQVELGARETARRLASYRRELAWLGALAALSFTAAVSLLLFPFSRTRLAAPHLAGE